MGRAKILRLGKSSAKHEVASDRKRDQLVLVVDVFIGNCELCQGRCPVTQPSRHCEGFTVRSSVLHSRQALKLKADEIVPVPNGPEQSFQTGTGTNSIACCSKHCKRSCRRNREGPFL